MRGRHPGGEPKAGCSNRGNPPLSLRDRHNPVTNPPSSPSPPARAGGWGDLALLLLVTLALFVVRATGPSNLLDNDQERPAAYVLDAVLHGRWWCQTDWTGDIMSKPPLFTWIAALATLPVARANLVSLYFPCLVAMALTVGLIFRFGKAQFTWAAGFTAGLMYLASPSGVKHIALARTDALFAATVALTALLGYRAWTTRRGWPWFWAAAALATLTKGPLGVVLGAMGLLAAVWEKRAAPGAPKAGATSAGTQARSNACLAGHLIGIALFVVITGGWFWLAYRQGGQAFIDKVIGRELVGHMVSDEHGTFGIGFVKAPLYWLSRFLPWSLLAVVGLWRVVRRPAAEEQERRFERFLFCWIVGGLFLFSLAKHQRGDLPLPLAPPAALLAGREAARWIRNWTRNQVLRRSLTATGAALALYTVYLHIAFARTWEVRQSEGVATFAGELRQRHPNPPHILHVDSPYALQFYLNTMDHTVSLDQAAAALKSGEPCAVAVCNGTALREAAGDTVRLHTIGSCPGSERDSVVTLVSNQPR